MITNSDTRIILNALRNYEGAIEECLRDPELLPEEREGFTKRADAVDRLIKQMTPKMRIEIQQFDPAVQKWNQWSRVFVEGECSLGQMIEIVYDEELGAPFDYDENYQINVGGA